MSLALFAGGLLLSVLGLVQVVGKEWDRFFGRTLGLVFALAASASALGAGVWVLAGGVLDRVVLAALPVVGSVSFGLDGLSAFFAALLGFVGVASSLYSFSYLKHYEAEGYSPARFCFLYNLFLLSMLLVISAQNALGFLVFWEIMALSSFFLVVFEHKKDGVEEAGFSYLVVAHVGTAALIVMFLVLAFGAGGSFDFSAILSAFSSGSFPQWLKDAVFLLALVGFGAKAGLMPAHVWLPQAHPAAPSNVSALMSGVMLKVAVYGLVRVLFGFLRVSDGAPLWWGLVLLGLGLVSSILGVLYALLEHDIKRLLAMHSIENIGIIFIGLGSSAVFFSAGNAALGALALFAALFHSLNHALFKSLLFLASGAVVQATGTRNIDELGGLAARMPVTAGLFLVGAMSIAALPPLNGFASEWLVFQALIGGLSQAKPVALASVFSILVLAATSALAVAAFVKAFGIPFLGVARSPHGMAARDPSRIALFSMVLLAAACVVAGLAPVAVAGLLAPVFSQLGLGSVSALELSATRLFSPVVAFWLVLGVAFAALLVWLARKKSGRASSVGPMWDCGIAKTTPHMQYTATGFSMPVLKVFDSVVDPLKKPNARGSRLFEALIFEPAEKLFLLVAPYSRKLQTGRAVHYLTYLMVTLVAVVVFALL